jgi:hypothetical protein
MRFEGGKYESSLKSITLRVTNFYGTLFGVDFIRLIVLLRRGYGRRVSFTLSVSVTVYLHSTDPIHGHKEHMDMKIVR